MSERVYHSIRLTTQQCRQLFGYLNDEYRCLTDQVTASKAMKEDSQASTQLNVLEERITNLLIIQTQLSAIINQCCLFDEAIRLIDANMANADGGSVRIKQYMKNDDCVIYRQYIHTAHSIEPATIYVLMLRNDGGLTIVDNDDMQSHEVHTYDHMVTILKKFELI